MRNVDEREGSIKAFLDTNVLVNIVGETVSGKKTMEILKQYKINIVNKEPNIFSIENGFYWLIFMKNGRDGIILREKI